MSIHSGIDLDISSGDADEEAYLDRRDWGLSASQRHTQAGWQGAADYLDGMGYVLSAHLLRSALVEQLATTETPDPPRSGALDAVEPLGLHKVAAQYCCACGDPVITAVVVTPATRPVARYSLPVCDACADNHVEHGAIDRREATDSRAA
jgi:hypothetical protein